MIQPGRIFVAAGDRVVTEVTTVDLEAGDSPAASTPTCGLYRLRERRVLEWRIYMDPAAEALAEAALVTVAAEQSALRRVAERVARHAPPEQVFALVTDELSRLLDVELVGTLRFEPDGGATVLASRGTFGEALQPGSRVALPPGTVGHEVLRTGAPARVADYVTVAGPVGDMLRAEASLGAAGGPIVVDGRAWGVMVVGSTVASLPAGAEERVARFAELVSTAISNLDAQERIEQLVAEQSALRRVATLVAREYEPQDLFATLAEEVGVLFRVDAAAILRYDGIGRATSVAGWSAGEVTIPLGVQLSLAGENLAGEVQRTARPQRRDDFAEATGPIAKILDEIGIRSSVACPIVVAGEIWGVIGVMSRRPHSLPPDTEARIAEFSRHAGMAVANAKSRADLAQSRARIVRAGDDARRRFERDLHDGAQQRLVTLGLELRATIAAVPAQSPELRRTLSRLATGLSAVLDDLRELSRGLHPAALTEGGLGPALRSLARRSAVPVQLRFGLGDERFDEPVEVAAYFVVSEALTNTAKHARASQVQIAVVRVADELKLVVEDDGGGGADPEAGSGLTGLADRVEALGGTVALDSPAGGPTTLAVTLPIAGSAGRSLPQGV
jgi:signal transduction histidine kinase